MNDPLELLMQQAAQSVSAFRETSRYRHATLATTHLPNGKQVGFVRRRFLPKPEAMHMMEEHVVKPGDRLDNLANHYFSHPELYWQICDANWILRPADLTDQPEQVGLKKIRIATPPGTPAPIHR